MPRTGRGGARQGTPGTAYANRTDLNRSMPIETATGQGYGVAAEQQAAQRAIPVASQPTPGAQLGNPAQGPGVVPQVPATVNEQIAPELPAYPGELKFAHPTDYPNEPITAGIPMGDGPGPEALVSTRPTVANLLGGLASTPGASATLLDLASAARNLGL
jgi:hypothetical protein